MKKNYLSYYLSLLLITSFLFVFPSYNVFCQTLSGSYTINPALPISSTNFQSVSAAADSLNKNGISGNVVFNIASGIYDLTSNGRTGLQISRISGASASSTITFQSSVLNADSVLLKHSGTGTGNTVIKLDSVNFIIFNSISLYAQTGTGLFLNESCNFDSILNCKITTDSSDGYCLNFNSSTGGSENYFAGNKLTSAGIVVNLSRPGLTSPALQNLVFNANYLVHKGNQTFSVQLRNCTNLLFSNNLLVSESGYGLNSDQCIGTKIYGNTIKTFQYPYFSISPNFNIIRDNIIYSITDNRYFGVMDTSSWDYNLYYSESGLYAYATSGNDLNSIVDKNPEFIKQEYRLSLSCFKGVPLPELTTDIKGIIRLSPPSMGAYEYADTFSNLAVVKVLSPVNPVTLGIQPVRVLVKNAGLSTITSFTLKYKADNSLPVSLTWTGFLYPCDTLTVSFTGPLQLNVVLGTIYSLTVYSEQPNSATDGYRYNDTARVQFGIAAGSYTINSNLPTGGGNFSSFTEAVSMVHSCTISDTITFNVLAGTTYTENPIWLNRTAFPIRFIKSGTGPNPKIYGVNGVSQTDAVIRLTGCLSAVFDGIDVADSLSNQGAQNMDFGYLISNDSTLDGGARSNCIRNAAITMNRNNSGSVGVGLMQFNFATLTSMININNRFENLHISNCNSFGIQLSAGDMAYPDSNTTITSTGTGSTLIENIGAESGSSGIRIYNHRNCTVSNCVIRNITTSGSTTVAGIDLMNLGTYITGSGGSGTIQNNKIYNISATNVGLSSSIVAVGIQVNANGTDTSKLINNIIYNISKGNPAISVSSSPAVRGISQSSSSSASSPVYCFHNTVQVFSNGPNVSSTAFHKGSTSGKAYLYNNVFVNISGNQSGNYYKHHAIYLAGTNITLSQIYAGNNILYSKGTNGFLFGLNSTVAANSYSDLSRLKLITGQHFQSVVYLPKLDTLNFLNPVLTDSSVWVLNGRGRYLNYSSSDVNGVIRPTSLFNGTPDLGAYEVTPSAGVLPPAAIASPAVQPGIPVSDSSQFFILGEDTVFKVTWKAGFEIPQIMHVRQYSGERPPAIGNGNHKYMYNSIRVNMKSFTAIPYQNPGYNASIYYSDNWQGTNPTESGLQLAKLVNGVWSVPSVGIFSVDSFLNLLTATQLYDTSAYYTGTDQFQPLPVELGTFTASLHDKKVELLWKTYTEKNSDRFEIERSTNLDQWTCTGKVKAKGNSLTSFGYSWIDDISGLEDLTIYYRLKMIDLDGSFSYSKIVSVRGNRNQVCTVFPNPFKNELSVLSTAEISEISFTDLNGTKMHALINNRQEFNNSTLIHIATELLKPGIYFLEIKTAEGTINLKVIRN